MAVTAREVILVFRGQNYLSGAIRRVGRDVGSLSRSQQLNMQRAQLQVVGQRLRQSRAIAEAERASIQTGARRLSQERAVTEQQIKEMRNNSQLLRQQAELSRISRMVGQGRRFRGYTNAEMILRQKSLQEAVNAASAAISKQELELRQLEAREAGLTQREAQLTQVINTRTRAINLNTAKLEQNGIAMKMLPWERFQQGARYVEHAGRVLQMFGLIAGASFGFAAEQSAKFQTQITLAATQSTLATNNTTRQVLRNASVLQRAVQQLISAGTTAKPEELTTGLYTILSGVTLRGNQTSQLRQAVNILGQFNRVLTANYGQVEFNDVVRAGIALINNFGLSASQLPRVLNRMQASVRFGAMNMRDFVSSLSQVVPAFRGAHYNFNQLAADVAFVSRLFPSLRVGTTGLARLTETFAKYHTEISKAARVNIAPGGRLLPIDQIVAAIIKSRPELAKGGVDLQNYFKTVTGATSTVQARRVFVGYATQLKLYHTIAGQVISDNNELSKSFTDMSQTPQVRWAEFANQLRLLVMEVGAGAIPVFQALSRPIQQLARWFDHLSPRTQRLIGYIGAFTAALALLGGTALAIIGGLSSLITTIALAVRWFGIGRVAVAELGTEAGFISARFALGLGLVAAIPLLIKYHTQIAHIIHDLGGFQAVLIAVTAGMAALRLAPIALAVAGIATEANTAAAATGSLRLALLALGGPEVLAAIAVGVAALSAYVLFHDRAKSRLTRRTPESNVNARVVSDTEGNLFRQNVTANRGPSRRMQEITPAQARAMGANVNDPRNAIRTAIADSPRYQHAIRANQVAVDRFNTTLDKQAAKVAIDRAAGVTSHRGQRNVQQWISIIEQARRKMLGSPHDLQAAQRYENLVNQLNTRFKDQPALLSAINDVLGSYDTNLKKATNSAKTLGVTFQDVMSKIQSMYQGFQQQEQSIFGTLFEGPFVNNPLTQNRLQWGGRLTGLDLLRDLRLQMSQFRQFHGIINNLQRRGASNQLIDDLLQKGPSALPQIQALNRLSPSDLHAYFSSYNQAQKMIQQQTMRDLNRQLRIYRQHGRNIALAIIAGLRDENVNLTQSLTRMIRRMFPGLPTGATGPGGRPTHTRIPQAGTTVVHNTTVHNHGKRENVSEKNAARHASLKARARYTGRGPGPR